MASFRRDEVSCFSLWRSSITGLPFVKFESLLSYNYWDFTLLQAEKQVSQKMPIKLLPQIHHLRPPSARGRHIRLDFKGPLT